jgi:hypothetical protein
MKATGKNGRVHLDLTVIEAKALMTFVSSSEEIIEEGHDCGVFGGPMESLGVYRACCRLINADGGEILHAIKIAEATGKDAA